MDECSNEGDLMICEKCQENISQREVYRHAGRNLCEDCYIEEKSVPKTCDPMAVRSAKIAREKLGQKGEEGLLPVQRNIYNYLKEHGKATAEQIAREFNLNKTEMEKNFSVLRHCELVKGMKQGNKVYLTLMNGKKG